MDIIAEVDIVAINFQPLRTDNFQSATDAVKLRHKPPARIESTREIYQKPDAIGFTILSHRTLEALCAIQIACNQGVFQWSV